MIIPKLKKYMTDPVYRWEAGYKRGLYDGMPDDKYLRKGYRAHMGKKLNLENPETFNEKLQWLKLHDRRDEYTVMVDKYAAKEYVGGIIGEEHIIPLLGVWDSFDDIDFDSLPERFVLKCNHDCASFIICKDKSSLDIESARKKLTESLGRSFYLYGREWPYKNVKPRIIAEEYIEGPGGELPDYKVLCFGGVPKIIEYHTGRSRGMHSMLFFDTEWNLTEITNEDKIPSAAEIPGKPAQLEEMLKLSAKLSKGIPHVRVDWFCTEDKLYFGELTFYDGCGWTAFDREEHDLMLGSWIELPEKNA